MSFTCYICKAPLSEFTLPEHIIPKCIGGQLASRNLICDKCNNDAGLTIDAAFCRLFLPWTNKYSIKRNSPIPPATVILDTGEKVKLGLNWELSHIDPIIAKDGKFISVRAGDRRRVLQEVERIKNSLDSNEKLEFVGLNKVTEGKRTITFDTEADWPRIFRCAAKIALNYYVYITQDHFSIEKIVQYLKGEIENLFIWISKADQTNMLYPGDICHLVHFRATKNSKCLYAYLEFFSSIGFIVLLNPRYVGTDRSSTYIFDPVNSRTLPGELNLNATCGQIIDYIISKPNLVHVILK